MGIFEPFRELCSTELREIAGIEKNLVNYQETLLVKIRLFHEIFLKIFDFSNSHFFERSESGYIKRNSVKIYEHYFYFIKRRLKKIQSFIRSEAVRNLLELKGDERLTRFLSINPEFRKKEKTLMLFFERMEVIHKNLTEQGLVLKAITSSFKRFVGDEKRWEKDYESSQRVFKGKKLYESVVADKDIILREWHTFVELLEKLKELIREELSLVLEARITDDVSQWYAGLMHRIRNTPLEWELKEIIQGIKEAKNLASAQGLVVYHATENPRGILPLSERRYPFGFFVCTGNERYARKIVVDHSMDGGLRTRVIEIIMPMPVFRLFIPDRHSGKPGDPLSLEAYEHAYVLPVSRYPLFNHYYYEGLIRGVK